MRPQTLLPVTTTTTTAVQALSAAACNSTPGPCPPCPLLRLPLLLQRLRRLLFAVVVVVVAAVVVAVAAVIAGGRRWRLRWGRLNLLTGLRPQCPGWRVRTLGTHSWRKGGLYHSRRLPKRCRRETSMAAAAVVVLVLVVVATVEAMSCLSPLLGASNSSGRIGTNAVLVCKERAITRTGTLTGAQRAKTAAATVTTTKSIVAGSWFPVAVAKRNNEEEFDGAACGYPVVLSLKRKQARFCLVIEISSPCCSWLPRVLGLSVAFYLGVREHHKQSLKDQKLVVL